MDVGVRTLEVLERIANRLDGEPLRASPSGLGQPIELGSTPVHVDPSAPFRSGEGAHGLPGAQRELAQPAQRGRLFDVPPGMAEGQELPLFANLGSAGGHPTLLIGVVDRGSYLSFPWRARIEWSIGAFGLMQCTFDVGAIDVGVGEGLAAQQQGVVWSMPADIVSLYIRVPKADAGTPRRARVGVGVAWGAQSYPFRRPLTQRIVGGAILADQQLTYPVPGWARGLRISADNDSAANGWTNANVGLEFRDNSGAIIGGDAMQLTSNLATLSQPAAVPLGATDVRVWAMPAANITRHMLEWELSL